jgi:peptidoglycan-N-acetylglucosamine deacetylase
MYKAVIFSLLIIVCLFFGYTAKAANKVIALTFDDGPSQYTPQILAILKQHNIKATFFVLGESVKSYPNILQETFAAGNVIGNHTYYHSMLSTLTAAQIAGEIKKTNAIIFDTIQIYPKLFRPPYGVCPTQCKNVFTQLGFTKIMWDYMPGDWDIKNTSADIIASKVIQHANSGAIIVLHDGGGDRTKTVAALPIIITTLKNEGYQFVTVSELLRIASYK